MTDIPYPPSRFAQPDTGQRPGWFTRAETWLDARGKPAWIVAMFLGFIFIWPVGLAILAYMIWSKRMFGKSCSTRHDRFHAHLNRTKFGSSGNSAFDAYKSETLRRLEEEQGNFEAFLQRLRDAKDKSEFDDFMEDRANRPAPSDLDAAPEPKA